MLLEHSCLQNSHRKMKYNGTARVKKRHTAIKMKCLEQCFHNRFFLKKKERKKLLLENSYGRKTSHKGQKRSVFLTFIFSLSLDSPNNPSDSVSLKLSSLFSSPSDYSSIYSIMTCKTLTHYILVYFFSSLTLSLALR